MKALLRATLAIIFALSICQGADQPATASVQTEKRSVKLGGARSVRAEVHMGAGDLNLTGGAKDLLNADFIYSNPSWRPDVGYEISNGRGTLEIREPEGVRNLPSSDRNSWSLRLNDDVPMELEVHLGVGKSELTLGWLTLRKLDVETGVGECVVDLTGDWKRNLNATVRGGIGKTTVRLPSDTGVMVRVIGGAGTVNHRGLRQMDGAFVNDLYGKSAVTLEVDVRRGMGDVNLEVAKSPGVI
jgi:hypothetical protein